MSLSLDSYRTKLIAKILDAGSQEEVRRFIDTAIRSLEQGQVNGHIIARFAEKAESELNLFSPFNKDAKQWSNIQMGKIHLGRILSRMKTRKEE